MPGESRRGSPPADLTPAPVAHLRNDVKPDEITILRVSKKSRTAARMERVNLMLSAEDNAWLSQCAEIHAQAGARVSRSEIVRAAIAGLKELHRLAPQSPLFARLIPSRSGSALSVATVVAARIATDGQR